MHLTNMARQFGSYISQFVVPRTNLNVDMCVSELHSTQLNTCHVYHP